MPLRFEHHTYDHVCKLSVWAVNEIATLVDVLAWLYLRKPNHAAHIIQQLDAGAAAFIGQEVRGAIDLLKYNITDIEDDLISAYEEKRLQAHRVKDARVAQRDGLLFQHLSWVAARMQFPGMKATPPHVRKADKGFDGVLLELVPDESLARVVLCEDKATINPRPHIRDVVWQDITDICAGQKDLEILAAITGILDTFADNARHEEIIANTIWERARQFRISVTASPQQLRNGSYQHLFDGFDECAIGDLECRIGEVMPLEDVRAYLNDLSERIITKLETHL